MRESFIQGFNLALLCIETKHSYLKNIQLGVMRNCQVIRSTRNCLFVEEKQVSKILLGRAESMPLKEKNPWIWSHLFLPLPDALTYLMIHCVKLDGTHCVKPTYLSTFPKMMARQRFTRYTGSWQEPIGQACIAGADQMLGYLGGCCLQGLMEMVVRGVRDWDQVVADHIMQAVWSTCSIANPKHLKIMTQALKKQKTQPSNPKSHKIKAQF